MDQALAVLEPLAVADGKRRRVVVTKRQLLLVSNEVIEWLSANGIRGILERAHAAGRIVAWSAHRDYEGTLFIEWEMP